MTEEEKLRARVETVEKDLTIARSEAAEAKAKTAALEAAHAAALAKVTAEKEAAIALAVQAETKVVSVELDALIGTKITPAEKEPLLELAVASRTIFDKTLAAIKARADMPLTKPVMTNAGPGAAPSTAGASDNGVSLDAAIRKSISATARA